MTALGKNLCSSLVLWISADGPNTGPTNDRLGLRPTSAIDPEATHVARISSPQSCRSSGNSATWSWPRSVGHTLAGKPWER